MNPTPKLPVAILALLWNLLGCRRHAVPGGLALVLWVAALSGAATEQTTTLLHEHPAIQYATRPLTDRVARMNQALASGTVTLERDGGSGYLRSVLKALGLAPESQVLVFSKTGIQRDYTGPRTPRALYFDESVVVGYVPGSPALEVAVHDPQQGVAFYTLDQSAPAPVFTRRTTCLACHVAPDTLDVPGMIVRSHSVDGTGAVMTDQPVHSVNHQTPHTRRWGGWFVTAHADEPHYSPLGHLGNITLMRHADSGPSIVNNHVFVEWMNSDPESRGHLAPQSDLAALLVFDHQMHAMNLLTRLNWDARIAGVGRAPTTSDAIRRRVDELADYLLFVDEAPLTVSVSPRAGFAEALEARVPRDRRGRSFGQLDLTRRLLRYPCSYLIYSEAFDGLPVPVKDAVYIRLFEILTARDPNARRVPLSDADRQAVLEILLDTKRDLPPAFGSSRR